MSTGLIDPSALVADSVDAASPAAAAGSLPDPAAAPMPAPPLPAPSDEPAAPSAAAPGLPLPAPAADAGPLAAPPMPMAGAQPSAPTPGRGAQILQQLLQALPAITTAAAASRMSLGGGAGLMDGFVRGHQAALQSRMQQEEFQQHKQQMAASFVEHAMGELTTIGSSLGPAAYAQAVSAYKQLAPSFGIDPAVFDKIGTANTDVVSEKQREKLGTIYDQALKGLPDDMPGEDRAKVVVTVPGFGQMPLGQLAILAGRPIDPKSGAAIVPGAPDPNKSDKDRDVEALYTIQEQKLGRKLTRGEKAQIRADYVKKGQPSQTPEEQFLRSYATKLGKTPEQLTPEEQIAARKDWSTAGQDPAMRDLQKQSLEVTLALKKIQEGQQPSKDDAVVIAQQLLDHKMAPSQLQLLGGFGASGQAFKRMVLLEAQKKDPNFNLEEAESTYQLAKSPSFQGTVRYMDSVQESMPRLQQTANDLGNGNVKFVNGLANLTKQQLNDPTLKKFQTDVLLVGDEVGKILQGGGTGSATSDAKLKQASEILSTSDSPKSVAAALGEIKALIGFRRAALTRGTYLDKPSGVTVTSPGGKSYTLKDQAAADAFVAAAKAKGLWK